LGLTTPESSMQSRDNTDGSPLIYETKDSTGSKKVSYTDTHSCSNEPSTIEQSVMGKKEQIVVSTSKHVKPLKKNESSDNY